MIPLRSLLVLGVAALLGACQPGGNAEALQVVKENLAATLSGDVEAAMATTHPESRVFAHTEAIVRQTVEMEVTSEYEECRIAAASEDEVRVAFIQVTRAKTPGSPFRDNRVTGTHLLRRDGGEWKIRETRIARVDYL